MKSRLVLSGLLAALLALPLTATAADTIESVEKAVIEKWTKLNSMSAKIDMDVNAQTGSLKGNGTIECLNKDGKELVRLEMKMSQIAGDQKMEMSNYTIYDGEYAYTVNEMMGQKFAAKQNKESMSGAPGGKLMFESLKKNGTLTLLPSEKIDDKEVYVIEAKPKSEDPKVQGGMRVYIAKETGVTLRTVGLGDDGKPMMTMNFKDVQLNPKLEAERFKFKAPEGVEVMDMTGK